MSFLERFGDKISTVTMHGTLKRSDGSEEVRSGPLRKKPQAPSALAPRPSAGASNNASLHESYLGTKPDNAKPNNVDDDDDAYEPAEVVPSKRSPKPQASPPKRATKLVKPEKPSPTELNEQRAVTEHDQLAFSKKARPVQYEPCTLTEYKQEKPAGYYELGKLKPDLNADDLVEKRANKERIKEFSKNLRAINQTTLKKRDVVETVAPEKTLSTRDKALAFAKDKVPKPKMVIKKASSPKPVKNERRASPRRTPPLEPNVPIESELQQLQLKHRAARAQVEALMRDSS
ncbi:hypothetical protein SPRG_08395 [Saprolegnia parasitica CBS 223.65]|uniref:Uncharacterized protein n=1 Tax=Saprolegnia parasitica (strain CBS 223.65) TaxID=695850 RepID=A0A067CHN1_SAPPC|nr:hypothetical protein SPRG_08395 [Saprolegnia parasitica CBS 223.65]KDO26322.1 hypothetical protein SPRG_08395 [Saprolegnia parasitica CBS 223.65]|eukprot:XP_012203021.1 hypothetical protein SPRG_08395 [Saprolegnia parasitica CBS 223.65]